MRFPALLFLTYCYLNVYSQSLTSPDRNLIRKLDSISTADVPPKSPGVAVAIIHKASVVYQKYEGYASLEDSSLISPEVRFNIASNGKQFTALAILILEHQKRINLRDDIRKYFPKLYSNIKDTISIENLINHSSGIRDFYDLLSLQGITWWKQTMANSDIMKMLESQQSLNFKPGSQHLYSNSNYVLLALIVEKVTGRSFVDVTSEMFKALKMGDTSFEDNFAAIRGPIAKPYFNFSTWSNYKWIWNGVGDGNLFTTLPDLIQWEKLVNGSEKSDIPKKLIQKTQQLTDNEKINSYGYGVELKNYKGIEVIQHEGATGAWKAFFIRIPSRQFSFITLTNSGKVIPTYQTMPCVDLLLDLKQSNRAYKTNPQKSVAFVSDDELLGVYTNKDAFYFEFIKKEDGMYLRRNGRNDVKLIRQSSNVFRQLYDSTFIQEFTRDSLGNTIVTAYHSSHSPYTLTKQVPNWQAFDMETLKGRFTNVETGAWVEIKDIRDQQVSFIMMGKANNGVLVTERSMILNGYLITQDPADPSALFLDGDRLRRIRFEKDN